MRFRVAIIFVLVAVLWGVPYALIKLALEDEETRRRYLTALNRC